MDAADDRALVNRLLRGDEAAFDGFVDEYYPRLYRFASRRLGSDADSAHDIVQATFEKVIPQLRRYRGEAALFSWLCSFCRFELAAHWRQRRQEGPHIEEDSMEIRAALESLATDADRPQAVLEREELARAVRVALDHLPPRYDHALQWKYLGGLSVREIAGRLAITPKAAESLLTRARQAFRDAFAELAGRTSS
jgi:RNA polymerase sigma-70 factor, ECF subfamily